MVTIAVAAILLMVALPALQDFVRNNRLVAMTNDLIADLALARAEAIRRGGRVTVCASNSAVACSGTNWATGRLVFADAGTPGTVDSGEEVLRVTPAAAGGIALTSDSADHSQYLQYRPSGGTDASGSVSFRICDSRGKGRTVVVALSGQVTTTGEEGTTCP
jgi:type IV fimbrial biogenesis protein FimT